MDSRDNIDFSINCYGGNHILRPGIDKCFCVRIIRDPQNVMLQSIPATETVLYHHNISNMAFSNKFVTISSLFINLDVANIFRPIQRSLFSFVGFLFSKRLILFRQGLFFMAMIPYHTIGNDCIKLKHRDCFLSGDDRWSAYSFVLRRLIFSV